ncbi:MAG: hypothetical protein Q9207_003921 [Kuettlingeria erythrocarpa]
MLASGGRSVDVVEHIVSYLEDYHRFNAGKGAVLNNQGNHELEAGIVDGSTGGYGAVNCVDSIKNPVKAARLVMGTQPHCFLTGAAAVDVASRHGLDIVPNDYFITAARAAHREAYAARLNELGGDLETVGAVVLDIHGNLAAAGSTGRLTYKMPGRIGDTAITGAGLLADQDIAVIWQWRVWEDKKHVAFLTPFANTPGYTVLVPRKHLSSDVFDLNDDDYTDMVAAVYQVAQHLKGAFGSTRCGVFFEGFEID